MLCPSYVDFALPVVPFGPKSTSVLSLPVPAPVIVRCSWTVPAIAVPEIATVPVTKSRPLSE